MILLRAFLLGLAAYLIGSIPTAYVMCRLLKGVDIRECGSGNVGATNVMRVLGTGTGIVTLAIDLLKGFVAVRYCVPVFMGGQAALPLWQIFASIAVIAGHNWMIFLRFKGGKGVASTAGVFLALAPIASLSAIGVWGVVVAITRYVSLGSILAGIALPVLIWLTGKPVAFVWFSMILTVALVIKHRGNIKRLLAGTERRIGEREQL